MGIRGVGGGGSRHACRQVGNSREGERPLGNSFLIN